MSHRPYDTLTARMGHLHKEEVDIVLMPRADFMRAVDKSIENYRHLDAEEALADARDIASRMDHFPMSSWMTGRGCGCVIGELLVERGAIKRGGDHLDDTSGIRRAIRSSYKLVKANVLISFGTAVDEQLAGEIRRNGVRLDKYDAIVIVNDFSAPLPVQIVDRGDECVSQS